MSNSRLKKNYCCIILNKKKIIFSNRWNNLSCKIRNDNLDTYLIFFCSVIPRIPGSVITLVHEFLHKMLLSASFIDSCSMRLQKYPKFFVGNFWNFICFRIVFYLFIFHTSKYYRVLIVKLSCMSLWITTIYLCSTCAMKKQH